VNAAVVGDPGWRSHLSKAVLCQNVVTALYLSTINLIIGSDYRHMGVSAYIMIQSYLDLYGNAMRASNVYDRTILKLPVRRRYKAAGQQTRI